MTIDNPDPNQDEPTRLEHLSREVFELVDDSVVDITDEEIGERLNAALAAAGYAPDTAPFDDLAFRLDIDLMGQALDPVATSLPDLVQEILSMKAAAEEELQKARQARRRAERVLTDAQRRAAQMTADADAYLDEVLEQARQVKETAQREADEAVAQARREADEVRHRTTVLRQAEELCLDEVPTELAAVQLVIAVPEPGAGPRYAIAERRAARQLTARYAADYILGWLAHVGSWGTVNVWPTGYPLIVANTMAAIQRYADAPDREESQP